MRKPIASIDFLFPHLPPVHDAIGEYTAMLAAELAKSVHVRILVAEEQAVAPVDDVEIVPCLRMHQRGRFYDVHHVLAQSEDHVVALQYNPFSWGRRGWAPDLCDFVRQVKKRRPTLRLATMFHEIYMLNLGWRAAVMRTYQLRQFRQLLATSDVCLFSTQAWMRPEFLPAKFASKSLHLPVGANLPGTQNVRSKTRAELGIKDEELVLGYFGGIHPSKRLDWVVDAANELEVQVRPRACVLLHVGERILSWDGLTLPRIETGRLDAQAASDAIVCMDVLLAPFSDGVTTRRGSVMAALQNGVPVLSTYTENTDDCLLNMESAGLFLSDCCQIDWLRVARRYAAVASNPDYDLRVRTRAFYQEHFSWPTIAKKMLACL